MQPYSTKVAARCSVNVQMREYIAALETHLAEAHRQAVRLVKRQATLGSSLAEFGTAMIALGKCVTT